MHLVAGLGNPGSKYAMNRHNVGFMVVDRLAERSRAGAFRDKFKGKLAKGRLGDTQVVLLKPMTYMNLSGESVAPAMKFFKVRLDRLVVVHDELDLPFGVLRIKEGGGTAGHNGLRSIVKHCGGGGFARLRMGIGRPSGKQPVEAWVLSDFDVSERAELDELLDRAAEALEVLLVEGVRAAMNRFHAR
ncbi:MAG: aminoacyl-tRNA hydrolase [Myxococcota bacterium]